MPRALRPAVGAIYRFARARRTTSRTRGRFAPRRGSPALDGYRTRARRALEAGSPPSRPARFPTSPRRSRASSAAAIARFAISCRPSGRTSSTTRYATFDLVLDYCRRSANPIGPADAPALCGRIVRQRPSRATQSALRCSSSASGRMWLVRLAEGPHVPAWEPTFARFDVTEAHIAEARCDEAWRALMRFETSRARARCCESGRPLTRALPWRVAPGVVRRARRRPSNSRRHRCGGRRCLPPAAGTFGCRLGARCARRRVFPTTASRTLRPGNAPHDARRILPAADGAERHELLLQLPVSAAGKAARDHGALRLLPRSRRCRRRSLRSRARPHQARLVAHRKIGASLLGHAAASGRARACVP